MADIQSNIRVNIETSNALASLKALQSQISVFQKEMAASSAANAIAAKNLQRSLIDDINATGKFSASIKTISSTTDSFTKSLEKNKLSLGEYFRYGMASSKGFSRMFQNEFDTVNKVARERVKDLQTQYVSLGRDASGALKSIAIRPLSLDMEDMGTKAAIAAQRTQIFNQVLKQGSTNLLNFGKNTQWAGRQLMVGFTIPLSIFGAAAAKEFKSLEEASIKFKRVYGTAMTPAAETDAMLAQIKEVALEMTKFGVSVEQTMNMAASAAAMGSSGQKLVSQVTEATRLSVLGQTEAQQALDTTISLTNAFAYSTNQLAEKTNFLNAVENQTVTSIEDLTVAIPKAGPVIQQLGGDVEDLAFFMTAMKEGGINASEGANALKSGLASLINPTEKARTMLLGMGVDLKTIIAENQGNVSGIVVDFASALDKLDPMARAQAIEQLFGKFQFARLSALFQNVIGEGTQAQRVLELAQMTTSDLAALSAKELGTVEQSSLYKFEAAIEKFKTSMAPVGEQFMKMVTPLIEFGTKILDMFNGMSDGAKGFITGLVGIVGGIAPIFIMTFGLIANAVANGMKGFLFLKNAIQGTASTTNVLGEQTQYMTQEQLDAAAVAASLDQVHSKLVQTFTSEAGAIDKLRTALERAAAAQARFGASSGARQSPKPKNFADGGMVVSGPGGPKGDKIPANLSDGEVVLTADTVKQNPGVVAALLGGGKIKIPGFAKGTPQGKLVTVGGGAEMAHFSGTLPQMSAGNMLAQLEANPAATKNAIERLKRIIEENGSDYLVRVFDNQVVSFERSLHQRLTQNAEGQVLEPVPAKEIDAALTQKGTGVHSELISQLKSQGLDGNQIDQAVQKVQGEISKRVADLGEGALMTADDVDKLIRESYEAVSKADENIEKAYSKMREVSSFIDPKGRPGTQQGKRINMFSAKSGNQSYSTKRKDYREIRSESSPGEFPEMSAMRYTGTLQKELGLTTDEFVKVWKSFDSKTQSVLANLRGDAKKFSEQFFTSAKLAGTEVVKKAATGIAESLGTNVDVESQSHSPSEKTRKAAKNLVDGVVEGITQGKADVKKAATQTDVAEQSRQQLYGGRVPDSQDKSMRRQIERRSQVSAAQEKKNVKNLIAFNKSVDKAASSVTSFNSKMMAWSGAIGSISLVTGMLGVDLGSFGNIVTGVSTAMFTLATLTNTLISAERIKTAITAASIVSQQAFSGNLSKAANVSRTFIAGLLGLDVATKIATASTAGAGVATGSLAATIWAAIWPIAAVVGGIVALGIGIKAIVDFFVNEQKKVTGLGDTANMAADKVKALGEAFGVTTTQVDLASRVGSTSGETGAQTSMKQKALESSYGPEGKKFDEYFNENITAVGAASKQDAEASLKSLALQLGNAGFGPEVVDGIIRAIAEEAGRKDLDLKFAKVNLGLDTAEGQKQLTDQVNHATKTFEDIAKKNPILKGMKSTATTTPQTGYYGRGGAYMSAANVAQAQMTEEDKKSIGIAGGEMGTALESLSNAFEQGLIDADTLVAKVTEVGDAFYSMSAGAKAVALPKLAESMGMQDAIKGIADVNDQFLVLQAAAAGVTIDPKQLEVLKKGKSAGAAYTKTVTALKNSILTTAKATEQQNKAQDGLNASLAVQEQADNVQKNIDTYNSLLALEGVNLSAAEAVKYATNAVIQDAMAKVEAAKGTDQYATALRNLKGALNNLVSADRKWEKISSKSSGGSKEKSEFEKAIDQLKEMRREIVQNVTAFTRLKGAGLSAAVAWKYAQDPQIAAGVATAKNATQVAALVKKIRELEAAEKAAAWGNWTRNMDAQTAALNNQLKAASGLAKLNASQDQMDALTGDEEFMTAYAAAAGDAAKQAAILAEGLKRVKANSEIELKIRMSTAEGMQEVFEEGYDLAMDAFAAQEAIIEINFQAKIKDDQSLVDSAEEQIAAIQYQIDDYEAGLQEIAWQEEEVNKAYDERVKALDKIQKTNENITRQNKAQLTIADALSQGDIAAAAKAIEDARAQEASAAMQNQRTALDDGREAALGSLVSSSGLTRDQLEVKVRDLKKEIFTIEEQTLEPARERIRLAELEKAKQIESITVLGLTREQWDKNKAEIDLARVNSKKYYDAIKLAKDMVEEVKKKWAEVPSEKVTKYTIIETKISGGASSTGSGSGSSTSTTGKTAAEAAAALTKANQDYATGSKLMSTPGMVSTGIAMMSAASKVIAAKGYASGGVVGGVGTADSEPAMLTPGEFVMKRSAVGKYGVGMMRSLNNGSFVPSMSAPAIQQPVSSNASVGVSGGSNSAVNNSSVYNYSVNVNVSSANAGAQEIANTVMSKIKSVESQRVRGVRL